MTAYGTDAGFTAYATARSHASVGAASPGDRAAARLRASEFLDGRWGGSFIGYRAGGRDQIRAWPRSFATDAEGWTIQADEVPDEIERATYEAAIRELANPGSLTPDITNAERVTARSESVGSINESLTYSGGGGVEAQRPILTVLDQILARLVVSSSFMAKARRS